MNIEFTGKKWNRKKQILYIYILLPLSLLLMLYGIYSNFLSEPEPPPQAPASSMQQVDKNAADVQSGHQGRKGNGIPLVAEGISAALMQNPFIESSQLAQLTAGAAPPKPNAAVAGAARPAAVRPGSLPAIPSLANIPRPKMAIPAPAAVQQGAPQPTTAGAPPTIQGVLTGEGGSNMAIMSNGQVVGTGDMVGEARIAFIGGDGITFEDGKKMSYR